MSVPTKPSFIEVARMLNELVPELSKNVKPIKPIINAAKNNKELAKGLVDVSKRAKYIEELAKLDGGKAGNALSKAVSPIKKITDNLQKGLFKKINPKWGRGLGILLDLVQAGITILSVKSAEEIQAIDLSNGKRIEADLSSSFQRSINNAISIKAIRDKILSVEKSIKITTDRLYAEAAIAKKSAVEGRQKANDALYEVRQGRKIIDAAIERQVSNVNALKSEFSNSVKLIKDSVNQIIKGTEDRLKLTTKTDIQKVSTDVSKIQSQIQNIQSGNIPGISEKLADFQKQINQNGTITRDIRDNIYAEINKARKTADANTLAVLNRFQAELDKRLSALYLENDKLRADIASKLTKGVPDEKLRQLERNYADTKEALQAALNAATSNQKQINSTQQDINNINKKVDLIPQQIKQADDARDDKLFTIINKVNDKVVSVDKLRQEDVKFIITKINDEITKVVKNVDGRLIEVPKEVLKEIEPKIDRKISTTTTPIIDDVKEVNRRLGDQEKVNAEGNKKLDEILPKINSILPTIAGIPLIAGRAADLIRPSIPTIPQIENATATGVCRTLNGGCGSRALDDAVGRVNQHNTNNAGGILDAINTGANAALLAGQTQILNRLGDQVPGGISGKLGRISQWLQLDKLLNILTFAATVHNAFQLSNDIAVTLGSAIGNILQLIGIKDDDGSAIDVGQLINGTVENLVKGIVGAENYQQISNAWAKANRIYQATTNVLNSFLNLSQTILQASELIAAYTGRIGNALRKSGVILENAYGWMNPQPKFNRVTKFLEGLQTTASTVQMVTQAPLDVINATTEFTTASTDFVKAIKEDYKPENKPTSTPEPDELKAKETQSKANSQPLNFDFSDLFDGED